ncbi:TadE/TadG family type IV pilus assembly protein [Megasphaera sueciensis]|uniref:TadE/TadG family type IV pilus assembly protein n=1 Tax=Megasphaera sueciensis TaxID=349094 RepID=UPI003CFF882A
MQRISKYWAHNRGAIFVLFAVLFPLLIALVGLSVDFAYASVYRTRMQNAVDAAALAGAAQLGIADSGSTAKSMAITYVQNNSKKGDTITQRSSGDFPSAVDTIYVYPTINAYNKDSTNVKTLRVEMRQQAPLFFLKYLLAPLGITTIPIAVVATGEYETSSADSPLNYAMVGGLPGNKSIWFDCNGDTVIGDVHTNGYVYADGPYQNTINGTLSGSKNTIWGNHNYEVYYDTLKLNADTIDVSLNNSYMANVLNSYLPSQYQNTFSSSSIQYINAYSHTFYDNKTSAAIEQDFQTQTTSMGYVGLSNSTGGWGNAYTIIIVQGNMVANITTPLTGNVILVSLNGNIQLNNNNNLFTGLIYAPNGTITLNGSVKGSVIGKQIILHSGDNITYYNFSGSSSSGGSSTKLIADDGSNEDTGS